MPLSVLLWEEDHNHSLSLTLTTSWFLCTDMAESQFFSSIGRRRSLSLFYQAADSWIDMKPSLLDKKMNSCYTVALRTQCAAEKLKKKIEKTWKSTKHKHIAETSSSICQHVVTCSSSSSSPDLYIFTNNFLAATAPSVHLWLHSFPLLLTSYSLPPKMWTERARKRGKERGVKAAGCIIRPLFCAVFNDLYQKSITVLCTLWFIFHINIQSGERYSRAFSNLFYLLFSLFPVKVQDILAQCSTKCYSLNYCLLS